MITKIRVCYLPVDKNDQQKFVFEYKFCWNLNLTTAVYIRVLHIHIPIKITSAGFFKYFLLEGLFFWKNCYVFLSKKKKTDSSLYPSNTHGKAYLKRPLFIARIYSFIETNVNKLIFNNWYTDLKSYSQTSSLSSK